MSPDPPAPAGAFASIAELRAVQARLGELRRQGAEGGALWDAAEDFVRRGAATGVVLDSEEDRWSVQGLLDYWASALERAGRPRGDSSLAEFDPEQAPELPDDACPYLGLNAFQEANGGMFFGRDELVGKLVQHLGAHRLIALVGPSGSGKSSLAFAGLLRRLRQGALAGSAAWRILPAMVPGAAPRATLASRLEGSTAEPAILIVDQFEELFTMCESEAERAGFVADLLALVTPPSPPHRVVLTVRSDFESFVAKHPALYERYAAGRVAVTPPSAAELRQAVEAPAALVGLRFEAGVIDRLLQELLGEPAGLPLLQFTLLRLWEERRRNRVTMESYERVGGGRQALARTADAIYDAMIPEDQATARRIFLMVGLAVDDRHELTRTRVARAQFLEHGDDPGRVERVLDRLIEARLLRQTVSQDGAPQVEVAHEALVRNWPRLAEWLQEAQTSLAERRRLEAKAREWVRLGRGRSALMDEVELREAERWLASAAGIGLGASGDLVALIARSRQRVQSSARRHRWTIAGLVAVALALGVMLLIAVWEYGAAERESEAKEQQRLEAEHLRAETNRLLGMANLERGCSLLVESDFTHPMRALPYLVAARTAGIDTPVLRMLFAQAARSTPLVTFLGHTASVTSATFSPDGTRVLTASEDRTARVWDAATGKPVTPPLAHRSAVTATAFSADGARVVTASKDRTARVWDAATGAPVTAPLEHPGAVTGASFSPDGARVITVSEDRREDTRETLQFDAAERRSGCAPGKTHAVQVWDARTGKPVTAPLGQQACIETAVFSPDGTRVVTVSGEHTVRVWDAATGRPATAQRERPGQVTPIEVVTASGDRETTARVWDARTEQPVSRSFEHQRRITAVAFSPGGQRVVTASEDRTARVWTVRAPGMDLALEHQGAVTAAAFSPDGWQVVTASEDSTARVWDAMTGKPVTAPLEHQGRVLAAAFSRDGTRVVTASEDHTARVWDARTGAPLTLPLRDQGADAAMSGPAGRDPRPAWEWQARVNGKPMIVFGDETEERMLQRRLPRIGAATSAMYPRVVAAFSPDGTRVVAEGRMWDARTGNPVAMPLEDRGTATALAFSPDGRWVVTASEDPTARVRDVATGKPVTPPLEHPGKVTMAVFSPDGTRVATASEDHAARVWDARTGAPLSAPLAVRGEVHALVFSPDGTRVITMSEDPAARVWDATTGQPVAPPLEHHGDVMTAAFSPDGMRVVTASMDHTARVWDAATGKPVLAPLEHRGEVTAAAFSPDGTQVVTASYDGTARLWDARTGVPVTAPLEHEGGINAAAFSPDGTQVVTASKDQTTRVWDARTGKLVAVLLGPDEAVTARFSPDGRRVVTVGTSDEAQIWELPIASGSLDDWRQIARCSPFAILDGVFTSNPDLRTLCPHP